MNFDEAVKVWFRNKVEAGDVPAMDGGRPLTAEMVDWDAPVVLEMDFEEGSACPTCGYDSSVKLQVKYGRLPYDRDPYHRREKFKGRQILAYNEDVNLNDLMQEVITVGFA